ncbi:glycogen debranching enzyme, partial [Nonomuraea sp. NPDC055795]
LFLSQGVPMISHGDELGRSQRGNNNAYCQDNELTWIDWTAVHTESDLLEFTRSLARLRREHPVFQRRRFFRGRTADNGRDLVWLTPAGAEMSAGDWHTGYAKSLMVYLNGEAITEPGPRGERIQDDSFLLLINAHHEDMTFTLPGEEFGAAWQTVFDTSDDTARDEPFPDEQWLPAALVAVASRSLQLLQRKTP